MQNGIRFLLEVHRRTGVKYEDHRRYKMVILKLQGGLGNQLFQYAAYCRLSERFSDVYLDVSDYNFYHTIMVIDNFFLITSIL